MKNQRGLTQTVEQSQGRCTAPTGRRWKRVQPTVNQQSDSGELRSSAGADAGASGCIRGRRVKRVKERGPSCACSDQRHSRGWRKSLVLDRVAVSGDSLSLSEVSERESIYLDHGDNWVTGMNRNRTEQCCFQLELEASSSWIQKLNELAHSPAHLASSLSRSLQWVLVTCEPSNSTVRGGTEKRCSFLHCVALVPCCRLP